MLFPVSEGLYNVLFKWLFSRLSAKAPVQFPSNCGRLISDRIVGGDEAPPYAWPWVVSLQNYLGRHFCGGVLITSRHVLTAAHCVSFYVFFPLLLKISVGSGRLGLGDLYYVDAIHIHPSFRRRSYYDSDLAVIVLSSDVGYETANTVCLPSFEISSKYPFFSNYGVAVGWGHTNEKGQHVVKNLRQVDVKILPTQRCTAYKEYYLESVMICAGWEEGRKDACKGDSGGPLLWNNPEGNWELHGIISFGKGCANKKYPGVYTKVVKFNDWIRSIVRRYNK